MRPRTRIIDAETLRQRLIASCIARPEDIAGCSGEEILDLQQSLGLLPDSYKIVLGVIGRRAGRLVDDRELWIYADQLENVRRLACEQIRDDGAPDDDFVPEDAVFIGARYGEHPWFIRGGEEADSPVWSCNTDTGRVALIGLSVWDWVEAIVRDAETFIENGFPEQNARRANGPTPAPKRGFRAWTF